MTRRPGRKIARAQAHRDKHRRHTAADIHDRRLRSTIIMGVIGLVITVGIVSALVVARDDEDGPSGEPAPAPILESTTTLVADSTTTGLSDPAATSTAPADTTAVTAATE